MTQGHTRRSVLKKISLAVGGVAAARVIGGPHVHNKGAPRGPRGKPNLPPLLQELKEKYAGEKFDENGTLYVGENGILYTSTYGNNMRIVPAKQMLDTPEPPKSLPRVSSSFGDFVKACREGRTDTAAGFDYSARLTELILLGNLAQRAGEGKAVDWDGANMKVTNLDDLNQWLKYDYRKGWKI